MTFDMSQPGCGVDLIHPVGGGIVEWGGVGLAMCFRAAVNFYVTGRYAFYNLQSAVNSSVTFDNKLVNGGGDLPLHFFWNLRLVGGGRLERGHNGR